LIDKKFLRTREGLIRFTLRMLKKHGIRPQKSLGQHFLVDPILIDVIIDSLELSKEDIVAEIGSGLGTLTLFLAEKCKKVVAIEIDRRLVNALHEVLKGYDNVEIMHADALTISINADKITSNVPYSISSRLLEHLLKRCKFKLAALTFQLEFARRLYASPGTRDYSRITILANYYSIVEKVLTIPPSSFLPSPKVYSQLVKILPREVPPFKVKDDEFFFRIVRELFTLRNKTLRRALIIAGKNMKIPSEVLKEALRQLEPLLGLRVYMLRPIDFAQIANLLFDLTH